MERNYKINDGKIMVTSGTTKIFKKKVMLISYPRAAFSVKTRFQRFHADSGLALLLTYCPPVISKSNWLS